MPSPDLARPSKVEAHLKAVSPSNATAVSVITCPANSVLRLRTVYVANTTAAAATFSLTIVRGSANGSGSFALHSGVTAPAKNLFNVTTTDDAIYLEDGDSMTFAQSAATAALNLFVFYELIT